MANVGQAVVGVVGAVVGFFVGGPMGAVYGASLGLAAGGLMFPAETDIPPIEPGGLQIQTSQYGKTIPVIYGHRKVAGNLIFYGNFKTHRHETEQGGKGGGGGATSVHYTYSVSLAFGLCMGLKSIRKHWVEKKEYGIPRYYDGTQTAPDAHIQSVLSAQGHTRFPVWKNLCYVVLENFDLGRSPRIPQFTFEVVDGVVSPLEEVVWINTVSNVNQISDVAWNPEFNFIAACAKLTSSIGIYKFDRSQNLITEVSVMTDAVKLKQVSNLKWNLAGDRLFVTNYDARVLIEYSFDTITGELSWLWEEEEDPNLFWGTAIDWHNNLVVALVNISKVVIFSMITKTLVAKGDADGTISSAHDVKWNPNGTRIAVAGRFLYILYNTLELSQKSTDRIDCTSVAWNPDGDRIAVVSFSGNKLYIYSYVSDVLKKEVELSSVFTFNAADVRWNLGGTRITIVAVGNNNITTYSFTKSTNTLIFFTNSTGVEQYNLDSNSSGDLLVGAGASSLQVYKYEEYLRDTLPAKITEDILTNNLYGLGLPAANLDLVKFGATNTYCETHDLKLSLNFANKISVLDALRHVINHHNGYMSYVAGKIGHNQLKTETAVGSIVETDIVTQKDQFPIQINKGSGRDHKNKIIVQFTNLAKDYVVGTASAEDMVDIDQYGLKEESASLTGLTNYDNAEKLANLLLRKMLTNPEMLTFQLGPKKLGIKPGDVWSITDANTEITNKDYRIITVGENEDYRLQITATEEIPEVNELSIYGADTSSPPLAPDLVGDPGSVVNILVVEPPALYSAISGVSITFSESGLTSWSGASAYRSYSSGGTYTHLLSREQDGITGTVTAIGEIDGVKNIEVTLDHDNTLSSAASYNDFITTPRLNLTMVRTALGDRYLRFQNADLLSARVWRLSSLLDDAVHFPRLDEIAVAVNDKIGLYESFVFPLLIPATDRLRTLYYKIPSFNFAGIEQSLSDVSSTSITLTNASSRPLPPFNLQINDIGVDSTDTVITQQNTDQVISWQNRNRYNTGGYDFSRTDVIVNDSEFVNFEIEVYVGAVLKRTITQTAKSWTYTTAMQTTDGTTLDNLIIKLRQHNSSTHSDQKLININRV